MKESFVELDVEKIDYDCDNPRIKKALEKYGEQLSESQIVFALRAATENGTSRSYASLRDAIMASEGIMTPIRVIEKGKRYICIDGNTRLAIYKDLARKKSEMLVNWARIKAIVVDECEQDYIEKIRLSAHLVGPREWPAYEKARYLHNLHFGKGMSYGKIVDLCGGDKKDIDQQIAAYNDMNDYYRDRVGDDSFRIDRYSGFVELQKQGIKKAIFDAKLGMEDFGDWIHNGQIKKLADVRKLPVVLKHGEAKKLFLMKKENSIGDAIKFIEREEYGKHHDEGKIKVKDASIHLLITTLIERLPQIPRQDMHVLQNQKNSQSIRQVSDMEILHEQLGDLIHEILD